MAVTVGCGCATPMQTCWRRLIRPGDREGVCTLLKARHGSAVLESVQRYSSSRAGKTNATLDLLSREPKRPALTFSKATKEKVYVATKPEKAAAELVDPSPPIMRPRAIENSAARVELGIRQRRQAGQPAFYVRRTASENIPVYLRWKNNRSKVSTVLRKTCGDKQVLKAELATLCEAPVVDTGGYIEVMGNHQRLIKQWLKQIGF